MFDTTAIMRYSSLIFFGIVVGHVHGFMDGTFDDIRQFIRTTSSVSPVQFDSTDRQFTSKAANPLEGRPIELGDFYNPAVREEDPRICMLNITIGPPNSNGKQNEVEFYERSVAQLQQLVPNLRVVRLNASYVHNVQRQNTKWSFNEESNLIRPQLDSIVSAFQRTNGSIRIDQFNYQVYVYVMENSYDSLNAAEVCRVWNADWIQNQTYGFIDYFRCYFRIRSQPINLMISIQRIPLEHAEKLEGLLPDGRLDLSTVGQMIDVMPWLNTLWTVKRMLKESIGSRVTIEDSNNNDDLDTQLIRLAKQRRNGNQENEFTATTKTMDILNLIPFVSTTKDREVDSTVGPTRKREGTTKSTMMPWLTDDTNPSEMTTLQPKQPRTNPTTVPRGSFTYRPFTQVYVVTSTAAPETFTRTTWTYYTRQAPWYSNLFGSALQTDQWTPAESVESWPLSS